MKELIDDPFKDLCEFALEALGLDDGYSDLVSSLSSISSPFGKLSGLSLHPSSCCCGAWAVLVSICGLSDLDPERSGRSDIQCIILVYTSVYSV